MTIKEQFPSLYNKDIVYLDTAATAQTPQCVIDAISKFYAQGYGNPGRSNHEFALESADVVHRARSYTLLLLNLLDEDNFSTNTVDGKPVELITGYNHDYHCVFTSGATASMNILAKGFPLNKTDVVVLTELDHHATIVPWQEATKQAGATIKYIPVKEGALDYTEAEKLINNGCRVVCVPHVSNVTGAVQDLKRIVKLAKKVGAYVFVDGAQAVAHIDVNIEELGVHAYTFSAHKLYGPTGLGVLVVDASIAEQLQPTQFGGEMIKTVSKSETQWADLPQRLEAGTLPLAQIAGLIEAIRFIRAHKTQRDQEKELMSYLLEKLDTISQITRVSSKHPVSCVSFTVNGSHPGDIGAFLNHDNVCVRVGHHCAQPLHNELGIDRTIRVSLGIYTEKQDIDAFISSLKKTIETLAEETQ